MTSILKITKANEDKWLREAKVAAYRLKFDIILPNKDTLTLAFAYDDAIVKIELPKADILGLEVKELAERIVSLVRTEVTAYIARQKEGLHQ